ncbi:related to putidaredoxin reductase [Cephalotrichum gorgonifer]|uniref:Related to putidaredoxin reductase n=1 Tax=Cephalotrichum gorgonifer TaxID=2041049 RepID=A0AAE8N7H8_9PEZI|nr:related to putidaredoxin reductase [Cephalotrichum gorgonifer]
MSQEYKLKGLTSVSLQPGEMQEVEVEGVEGGKVLLVNSAGSTQALGTKCTHYGAPMVKGVLTKSGRLTCPWHGACFSAKTGDVEDAPALDALPVFKVSERDGAVYITGDEATIKSGKSKPSFRCRVASRSKPQEHKVVVVGGGSGALGVVEGLRENGYDGALAVISSEGYLPVDRPKLSKALTTDPDKIAWRDEGWYESAAVDMIADEVTGVDFAGRVVHTKAGQDVSYTRLVLATGGTPRRLPLEGFKDLENIFTLRTVHDTREIVEAIGDKGKKIVVVGSSFIGMEVAKATSSGNTVSVVGMEKVAMERVLGEQVGTVLQKGIEALGVKFYMSASVSKAEPSASDPSKVGAVLLKDGTRLEADLVILGVGVAPATAYLRDNKAMTLEKDGSVAVDEKFAVRGLENVYAVGDIATYPYHGPGGGGRPTRIEHWNVAQNAGRTVSRAITHPAEPHTPFIPVFWSALSAQVRYCGNGSVGWDDVVVQGDTGAGKFVAYYCSGETVVAMVSMGRDPAMVKSSALMLEGKMPSKTELAGGLDVLTVGLN